ncbi:hypothetical protein EHS25_001590 [Saitozyma podzolica]|uniref:Beta-xylosidase C-terminal Concanavalin A-like domain-containing protein n=1 Tax=Saitozyma podzolica TaxID=1890683 RepID=A0A427YGM1_9TREE|nr:hypothetical protein EHS25_001590 [Saitozyma podzolica]
MPFQVHNPILPGFNPDPTICRVGDTFFLVTSSFEFWPGLPVYTSHNLVEWELIGHAINRPSQGVIMRVVDTNGGLWAPTIRYRPTIPGRSSGRCSVAHLIADAEIGTGCNEVPPRGFYVWTEDIYDDEKWSDAIYFDETGIDQDLFFDDDGKTYLSVTHRITDPSVKPVPTGIPGFDFLQAAYVVEIDLETGRSLTAPRILRLSHTGLNEGSHIFKKDGSYYLITADGGTFGTHQEWVSRSTGPLGPYEPAPAPYNPMLFNADHPTIRNTGHVDLVEDASGHWWAVFLGVRQRRHAANDPLRTVDVVCGHLGRETFLAPVEWRDGWPLVNGGAKIELSIDVPALPAPVGEQALLRPAWTDNFNSPLLDRRWYFIRTPMKRCYTLFEDQGLRLYGNPYRLEDDESPAVLLRRQTVFDVDWTTEMDFAPSQPMQEAGTLLWLDSETYASIGVRLSADGSGGRDVVITYVATGDRRPPWRADRIPKTTRHAALPDNVGPLRLTIRAREETYELSCHPASSRDQPLITETISTEFIYSKFTGAHLGLYAMGADFTPCLNPAVFKYAQWQAAEPSVGQFREQEAAGGHLYGTEI